jgi:hypothetical protein
MTSGQPEGKVAAVDPDNGRQLYGQDPAPYRAGRPDYPERVYDVLVNRCRLRKEDPDLRARKRQAAGAERTSVPRRPKPNSLLLSGSRDNDVATRASKGSGVLVALLEDP